MISPHSHCAFYAKKKPTDSTPVGFFFALPARYSTQRILTPFLFTVNFKIPQGAILYTPSLQRRKSLIHNISHTLIRPLLQLI